MLAVETAHAGDADGVVERDGAADGAARFEMAGLMQDFV
jgi:hypothetical protein